MGDVIRDVQVWDGKMNNGNDGCLSLIFGTSGCGKSFLMRWIMAQNKDKYYYVRFMSNDPDTCNMMKKHMPPTLVSAFDLDAVNNIVALQERLKKDGLPLPWIALVLDDCADTGEARGGGNSPIAVLAQRGRHLKIDTYICTQAVAKTHRFIRLQAMYVFSGKYDDELEASKLRAQWFGGHPWFRSNKQGKKQWDRFYDAVTVRGDLSDPTRRMVMWSKRDSSLPAHQKLFIVQPGLPGKFRMCHADFWTLDYIGRKRVSASAMLERYDNWAGGGGFEATGLEVEREEEEELVPDTSAGKVATFANGKMTMSYPMVPASSLRRPQQDGGAKRKKEKERQKKGSRRQEQEKESMRKQQGVKSSRARPGRHKAGGSEGTGKGKGKTRAPLGLSRRRRGAAVLAGFETAVHA